MILVSRRARRFAREAVAAGKGTIGGELGVLSPPKKTRDIAGAKKLRAEVGNWISSAKLITAMRIGTVVMAMPLRLKSCLCPVSGAFAAPRPRFAVW
jgi:hypothetical protein